MLGAIALCVVVLGPANASAMFAAVVGLFGAAVSVVVGALKQGKATRTPPS